MSFISAGAKTYSLLCVGVFIAMVVVVVVIKGRNLRARIFPRGRGYAIR